MADRQDIFIEHMVQRKPSFLSRCIYLSPWLAVLCLLFVSLFVIADLSIAIVVLFGGSWGAWQVFTRRYVEFECILTNGELDVDRITGRRSRRRLLSVDCRRFEILAPCAPEYAGEMGHRSIEKRVDASTSPKSEARFFAVFHGSDGKRTILFFEPNQRMLAALRAFVPPQKFKKQT